MRKTLKNCPKMKFSVRHSLVHRFMPLPETKVMTGLSGNKKYNNDEEMTVLRRSSV